MYISKIIYQILVVPNFTSDCQTLSSFNLSGEQIFVVPTFNRSAFWDIAILIGADFGQAILSGAKISQSNLERARFEGADLENVDFQVSVLKNANFKDANLTGSNFWSADLAGADLTGAIIEAVNFRTAIITGTMIEENRLKLIKLLSSGLGAYQDYKNADLKGARF